MLESCSNGESKARERASHDEAAAAPDGLRRVELRRGEDVDRLDPRTPIWAKCVQERVYVGVEGVGGAER
jgi:hypothetical protein